MSLVATTDCVLMLGEGSPFVNATFGWSVLPSIDLLALAHRWVLVDADNAFKAAVSKGHVLLAGASPHVTYIDSAFPGRWLVVLHVQLHPELIDAGFA